ncbi:MAG: hypothetical protein Q8R39_00870 [bacterium]|nr:hypothetical protein [bacterium]MDZ4285066.1 hypothetical protein [Patescibacteria group bacterium]
MDPNDRQLLKHVALLVEENTVILRKLLRAEKMRRLVSALYWLAVLAISLGAYYFIQPYLDKLLSIYGNVRGGVENVGGTILKGGG